MAEFVRKVTIGFKEVHGGQSNPECIHVILTKEERINIDVVIF